MADLPLDASSVPRRTFTVVRRGFDQHEVRAYLHQLAELIGRLQRTEHSLLERAERAETRADLAEQLDEHRLIELVGEETARVLEAAKAAAADIRTKAEERAARLVRDGQEELAKLRAAIEAELGERRDEIEREGQELLARAQGELDRRSAEAEQAAAAIRETAAAEVDRLRAEAREAHELARAEAESILETARQEGRRMVAEAQAVRERVLRDLARRRRTARVQIERLNAGRERLVTAYEAVRRTVDEAMTELTVALPEARAAAEAAARRVDEEAEASVEQLEAELEAARLVDLPLVDTVEHDDGALDVAEHAEPSDDVPEHDDTGEHDILTAPDASQALDTETDPAVDTRQEAAPEDEQPARIDDLAPTVGDETLEHVGAASVASEPAPTAGGDEMIERRSSSLRLFRRRDLPVDMRGVAEESLVPVDAAASFETVRVVEVDAPPDEPDAEPAPAEHEPAVSAPEAGLELHVEGETDEAPEADAAKPSVDELFARIRAQRAETLDKARDVLASDSEEEPSDASAADEVTLEAIAGADEAGAEPVAAHVREAEAAAADEDADEGAVEHEELAEPAAAADGDATVLATRDEQLEPLERDLAKRLKRVLADEQNVVLDAIRRGRPKGVDDVLPTVAEHGAPYADAAAPVLSHAAAHGLALVDSSPDNATNAACDDLAAELARGLVTPLRERVDRSFAESEGDLDDVSERLRSLYREWKGQRITDAVRHFTVAAYARGAFAAAPAGCGLRWVVDTGGEACPDADDNALAGVVAKGNAFPTGDVVPPAHPGCRCIVLPERQ